MTLPAPVTEAGRIGLAALLADPSGSLIACDFDGTLAPIVAVPGDARASPAALDALRRIAHTFGQVAIISGRPAQWLVDVAGLGDIPGLVIAGQYGAQHWAGGVLRGAEPGVGLAEVRRALPDLVVGWSARIEDKGLSIVVHTRGAEHPESEIDALVGSLEQIATEHGLEAHRGRAVVEIRPPGFDKGGALIALANDCDATAVMFIGDDLGDLPAFDAVESMRAQGRPGLTACSASDEVSEVAQRADLVLAGPLGVTEWLVDLQRAAGG